MRKFYQVICLALFTLVSAGCVSMDTNDEITEQWTAHSPQDAASLSELADQGVISNLTIMESSPEQFSATGPAHVLACLSSGGRWLEDYNECEFMPAEQCLEHDGVLNSCASACRHRPEANICIKMCVPVCQFR
ncbi:hypothetical protein [Parendozoicomonas haliclonae]|uniref:Lipoprotein n=1 Tax=Parendozoicomonas haliclonae TaxID=1960125 RepID=A0A1X7AII2_9GAMM|nr:hypothetical protein [Parendozoicomonas haliclonae]SMA45286.1 hypothetical protein EHSB41UT_01878 [Parendozoicomonas haliclonae]